MNPEAFDKCSTILIDIAGTVGSIDFKKDTLFAFAKKNIEEYLSAKWEDEEVKKLVAELKTEEGDGNVEDVAAAVARFNALTDADSVNVGVKALQGRLYKQGYEKGELKAHVFDDIRGALEEWSKHRRVCVYSGGAADAQRLYFAHSTAGDLGAFIADYFDAATAGAKTASASYTSIAASLAVPPHEIVFLSDDVAELEAATRAGCASVLVARDGSKPPPPQSDDRVVVKTFTDLLPLSAKRKSQEESPTSAKTASAEEPPKKIAKVEVAEAKKVEEVVTPAVGDDEAMEVDSAPKPTEAKAAEKEVEEAKPTDKMEATSSTTTTSTPTSTTPDAGSTTDKPATDTATPSEVSVEKTNDASPKPEAVAEKVEKKGEKTAVLACELTAAEATKPSSSSVDDKEPSDTPKTSIAAATTTTTTTTEKEEKEKEKEVVVQNGKDEPAKEGEQQGEQAAEAAPAENGDAATDEKENKSEIANGTTTTTSTTAAADDEPTPATPAAVDEVKAKKLEEAAEAPAAATAVEA